MKKFVISVFACFACIQSDQAMSSIFGESINEYTTLIGSLEGKSEGVISQNEFIIDIKRNSNKTNNDSSFEVHYTIKTLLPSGAEFNGSYGDSIVAYQEYPREPTPHNFVGKQIKVYDTLVKFTPNPKVGSPEITVISVTPLLSLSRKTFFYENEEASTL